jgi:histidinol phosphatase-like PHP family hydrolase
VNVLPELVKSNFHIHTNFSICAAKNMTVPYIILQAKKAGLETVGLVDHDHDNWGNLLDKINYLKEEVQEMNPDIKVIVGAELSAYGINKYGVDEVTNEQIDFRFYATNHYHLDFWEHPKNKNARAYAEHTLQILKNLIVSGRADCIAHPFVGFYLRGILDDFTEVTRCISDNDLVDILELGVKNNVSWELNTKAVYADPIFAKRLWRIGREVDATFVIGTDAHQIFEIEERKVIELKLATILS